VALKIKDVRKKDTNVRKKDGKIKDDEDPGITKKKIPLKTKKQHLTFPFFLSFLNIGLKDNSIRALE